MQLTEKTKLIKFWCKQAKNSFFQVGQILKEIRDKQLYLGQYENFTEYLESEEFEFNPRHAYKLITVFEEFGNVPTSAHLTVSKLIELTHVKDKETREELIPQASKMTVSNIREEVKQVNTEQLAKEIHRFNQRQDTDLETESDSKLDKILRQGRYLLNKIDIAKSPLIELKQSIETWCIDSNQFPKETDSLKAAILLKLEEK